MIDSTSPLNGASRANGLPVAPPTPWQNQPGAGSDSLSTDQADGLQTALDNQPAVRADVVERGRALAADPNYPSSEILRRVAGAILNSPDLSEDQS